MSALSGYSWYDINKVLLKTGWQQIPNHREDYLTYKNGLDEKISIVKENNYNLDYFHKLIKQLGISHTLFVKLLSQ